MASEKSVMLVIRAARPSFRNCQDKVAFAVHAAFMAAGYILHSTGLPAFEDGVLTSCPVTDEVGMEDWNELDDYYAFLYSHPQQSSKRVLMKGGVFDENLHVDVLKEGEPEESSLHLEVNTMEYVENSGDGNYGSQFKNLAKLVADVKKELLSKLDGYSISTSGSSNKLNFSATAPDIGFRFDFRHTCSPWCMPPLPPPPPPIFPGLPNPWLFGGRPAPGTMPNGPYPIYPEETWRTQLQTPTSFDMAPGRRGRGMHPEIRPHPWDM